MPKKKKPSKLKIVKCILTQTPPHPEDGDINRSELIAERVVVPSGLDVEQQESHCIHCDVGDHRERIPAHERELRCVLRIRRLPGRMCRCGCVQNGPVRSEFHFSVLTADQLGNERQVGDLRGGPAELKDDDERGKVDQTGPLRGARVAAQTLVEDEGKGQQHAQCTWITHTHTHTRNDFQYTVCHHSNQLVSYNSIHSSDEIKLRSKTGSVVA